MDQRGMDSRAPDRVREEAIAWLARLRSDPSRQDQAAFEAWYAADPRHADSYDALLDSWEAMQLASATPAAQGAPAPPPRPWTKVAAAAAVILVVAVSLFLAGSRTFGPAPDAMLATSVGEIRTIALADGSRVTLDTDSRLRVDLDDTERRLFLERGRARFEVAHDARRPFVVAAGASKVVAHGTVFDVDLRQPRTIVSLLQGSVPVRIARLKRLEKGAIVIGDPLCLGSRSRASRQHRAVRSGRIPGRRSPDTHIKITTAKPSTASLEVGYDDPDIAFV